MSEKMRARSPLFEGLDSAALEEICGHMTQRRFGAREILCHEGDAGESLFVIERGLAQVVVGRGAQQRSVARVRRGEVLGELSLISGEPRSATVIANVPTEVLELSRDTFLSLVARYPVMLANLNSILSRRLTERNVRRETRGEAVALVTGQSTDFLGQLLTATRAALPGRMATFTLDGRDYPSDLRLEASTVENALAALDDLLANHSLVLVRADGQQPDLPLLLEQMDRVLIVDTEDEAIQRFREYEPIADHLEIAVLPGSGPAVAAERAPLPIVRSVQDLRSDVAWLGRHLSRTKLGLALGAGGAKGYAHIGALYVLEQAGYAVDFVAGSSIGAMVGAWMGLGSTAARVEQTMRGAFTPETVAAMFKLSVSGMSSGLDVHIKTCRETTENLSFSDLRFPVAAMAVDLNTRQPASISEGPLWEALVASTCVAGMYPPFERGNQRLVDGVALVPVPTDAARELGADVVLSVNLMSRDTLDAWPGQPAPEPQPKRRVSRMLDTLLEVMDLSQIDSSVQHAARADVTVTPRFGPGSWRDFDRADLYLEAGRKAAEAELSALQQLARPQSGATG